MTPYFYPVFGLYIFISFIFQSSKNISFLGALAYSRELLFVMKQGEKFKKNEIILKVVLNSHVGKISLVHVILTIN